MRSVLIASLAVFAAACGDKDLGTPDACNPLGGQACITPWPSSVYESEDTTTETKMKVDIPAGALPKNFDNIELSPALYNKQDGFSYAAPMIAAFPTGVDPANLVDNRNIGMSITDASPTVLIDMSTGELVPHFAEVDTPAAATPESQALFIRPAKLLKPGTRYAVAIKSTLKAKGGGALPISEGFQAILDDEETSHPLLEKVRPRYKDIFAALEAKGIHKTDLVLAWDFTTRSHADVQSDLLNARTAALAMIGDASALHFTIDTDTTPGDTRIARQITGTFDAPLFLDTEVTTASQINLLRDGSGKPMASKLYRVPFTAIIPQCALQGGETVPIMLYGHGLLGASNQVASGGTRAAAAEICAVAVGTDLRGMSEVDVPNVALALNDGNDGHLIFDTLIQGMMNHIALVQIAKGPMAAAGSGLFRKNGDQPLIDPDKFYYYGISQGGIMGTTICGIDPVIKKCVVQVNGINYSMLLERSADWPQYAVILQGGYGNPLVTALMINLMQNEWDRTEPVAVADVLTTTGFPNTPAKQVFMQFGIADDQVPNVGSELQMRTMGIPLITPTPFHIYGVEEKTSAPSGAVMYDFGLSGTIPLTNTPPPRNDVHSNIRNKKATTDMMKTFYETGVITNVCTAPNGCVCTVAGACGPGV
ncbi:MAG TPA: hypothetical protein VMZ53_04770 [Kofleriaceae bacterium]|nr:hypothetical protein [Kofleriaceae bacterium]